MFMINGVNKHQFTFTPKNGGKNNMGAQSFVKTITAATAQEAYQRLYDSAVYEYGNDSYNGTISTCSMGRCKKSFSTYKAENEKQARELIDRLDNGEKWIADYIDLGVVEIQKVTVKKVVKTYTADYRFMFGVYKSHTNDLVSTRALFKTKGEADKYAINLALKGQDVQVRRRPVNMGGNDIVSTFETVRTPTKKKTTKTPNAIIQEKHKFVFFGWAAC
jgi:hypothetical protein